MGCVMPTVVFSQKEKCMYVFFLYFNRVLFLILKKVYKLLVKNIVFILCHAKCSQILNNCLNIKYSLQYKNNF